MEKTPNMRHTTFLSAALVAALLAGCPATAGLAPGVPAPGMSAAPSTPQLAALKQIPVGKAPHGAGGAGGFIYNSDVGDARVSVIDAATDVVVTTIPFPGGAPGYVKAFHDEKAVMILDTKQNDLVVIDPAQQHKILQRVPIGIKPDKIRIDGDRVLVSCAGEGKLVMLAFEADRAKAPGRTEFMIGTNGGDHRDAAIAKGWLLAPNPGDNNVSVINLVSPTPQTLQAGNGPGPVGIGVSGETAVAAIVGNAASNSITVFELPGFTATTIEGVGLTPTDMQVDSELGRAYVTMAGSNELAVIDYRTKTLVGKVPTGARPVHIYMAPVMPAAAAMRALLDHPEAPVSHELWIGNDAGASVTIVDGQSLRVKATVSTGVGHHKMGFSGAKGYVSNITDNTVSVVDRTQVK